MRTIIYLYHSREAVKFVTEKWQESDYCLIRLGVPALLWQNLQCLERETQDRAEKKGEAEQKAEHGTRSGIRQESDRRRSVWSRVGNLLTRFQRRRGRDCQGSRDRIAEEEADAKSRQSELLKQQVRELLWEVQELQTALCLLGDNPNWTYCVYEEYLREKINTRLWWQQWSIPEFKDYNELMWVEKLMPYAVCDRYLILGWASCMPQILCERARRMRSVRCFLQQKQYNREVEDFIEYFYDEYGLAVEVHLLEQDEEWIRVRPSGTEPVNVIDFTGEEKLSACDVAKGSVWLDMDSMEGKCRRIETRNQGINYFSLKKQWEQRQKAPIYLDTISKNRYNT